jgi:hypothetical protein
MRPRSVGNTASSSNTNIVHTPGNPATKSSERRLVDISRSEQVETDLTRLTERRDTERCYFARRREEYRIAWCAYYRCIAGALHARAEECIVRAEKLSEAADQGEGGR